METFEDALRLYQRGSHAAAYPAFEALAKRGDQRAQLILGLMLIDGDGVAADRVRGYSWLQIAAQGYYGAYANSRENYAADAVLSRGATLSGPELLRAEQATQAFLRDKAAAAEELKAAGRRLLMSEAPAANDKVLPGCALDRTIRDCPEPEPAPPGRESCTGQMPPADSPPTGSDESARITPPDYPVSARKSSAEGVVVALAHIDWTGYVCRITMTVGTGFPAIDQAALDAMRTWRLKPAFAGGEPVESLYDVSMGFGIKDYKLDLDRGPSDLSPRKGTRLPSN